MGAAAERPAAGDLDLVGDVAVVAYEASRHAAGVARLARRLWSPSTQRNLRFLEWKLGGGAGARGSVTVVAVDGARVVGTRSLLACDWEAGSPPRGIGVALATDLVVARSHERRNLVRRMTEAAVDLARARGTSWAFNLSPGPATFLTLRAAGWSAPGSFELWRRVAGTASAAGPSFRVDPPASFARPAAMRLRMALASLGLGAFTRFDRRARRRGADGAAEVTKLADAQAMAELVAGLPHDGRWRRRRTTDFLAWRYANPESDYRFLSVGTSRLDGFLVLGASRGAFAGRVAILDWEAARPEVGEGLLERAIALGRFTRLEAWSRALPRWAPDVLSRAGFRPAPAPLGVATPLVLALAPDSSGRRPSPLRVDDWDLRECYADGV